MYVLLLTIFISLVLVVFFLVFFLREGAGGQAKGSAERDSLLPLEEDRPAIPTVDEARKPPGKPGSETCNQVMRENQS